MGIQEYIKANIPSPPTPPEEIERREKMAAELARLEAEEAERERLKALKEADPALYDKEMKAKLAELKEGDPAAYEAEMKKLGKSELDRLLSKHLRLLLPLCHPAVQGGLWHHGR